jgi:hypothetical protein
MLNDMAAIAAECVNHPTRRSVWSAKQGAYICPDAESGLAAIESKTGPAGSTSPTYVPSLSPQFKIVFLTSAGGTLLFAVICITLTLAAGKDPPPLFEKVVMSLFDLVKIGFGAMVGLLGAQTLQVPKK